MWEKREHDESFCKDAKRSKARKVGLHQSMKGQFTIKYLIFRVIWKIPVLSKFSLCYIQIPCFPCLEKLITKFPLFSLCCGHPELRLIHHPLKSVLCLIRTISLDALHWLKMLKKGTLNLAPQLIRTKILSCECDELTVVDIKIRAAASFSKGTR